MNLMMLKQRLRSEGGWLIPISMNVLAIMLITSIAAYAIVDTQQKRTRQQREREVSMNLAEAVLYAQGFRLSANWPGTQAAGTAMPVECSSSVANASCPTEAQLKSNINTVDTQAKTTWVTKIRDNGGDLAIAYQTAKADLTQSGTHWQTKLPYVCTGPCRWDANGDKKVWVSARAIVRGRPRTVVAVLRIETLRESTPQAGVTSGGILITNSGNKTMIQGKGSQILVRCNPSVSSCVKSIQTANPPQITPSPVQGNPGNWLNTAQLERFKQRAIADGKYFAGCPGDDLRGAVVWVDNCSYKKFAVSTITDVCNPSPTAYLPPGSGGNALPNNCINQIDRPGVLIWRCGAIELGANFNYVGVIYTVNGSDGNCTSKGSGNCDVNGNAIYDVGTVLVTGGAAIWGAVAIDRQGCFVLGSNGLQMFFDPNVFNSVQSYGTVGLVQDTWRELAPS